MSNFKNTATLFLSTRVKHQASGIIWFVFIIGVCSLAFAIYSIPDPEVFNKNVEQIFLDNDFSSEGELKLLEVLASSGSLFEKSISLYSRVLVTLVLVLLLISLMCVGLLQLNVGLRKQIDLIADRSVNISSIKLVRAENSVRINTDWYQLTPANIETLSALCEAALDGEFLSGLELESIVSNKPTADCEDAAGAMRIKRLRDNLGNQIIANHLLRHLPSKGYQLALNKNSIDIQ